MLHRQIRPRFWYAVNSPELPETFTKVWTCSYSTSDGTQVGIDAADVGSEEVVWLTTLFDPMHVVIAL
jgi:hypothetical protein